MAPAEPLALHANPQPAAPVVVRPQVSVASQSGSMRAGWGSRLRDFLTDGAIAALCDELTRLSGAPVWLRDQSGEAIVPVWSETDSTHDTGGHPWSIVPEPAARRRAFELLRIPDDGSHDAYAIPLRISTGVLGAMVACLPRRSFGPGAPAAEATRAQSVRRSLLLLASSVSEVCEAQVALRQRVMGLDALYRLSSLLTTASDPDDVLKIALDLAIQVIGVDAGSIAVLDDSTGGDPFERRPVIAVARNLSESWLDQTHRLSRSNELRRLALAGEIVAVEDLMRDPRVQDVERVRAEGLHGMLSVGLLDQGRPIGLIRLYSRTPRVFADAEGELLRAIAEHSASALTNARLRALRSQDEAVKRQVRLAADVQRRMLPRTLPKIEPFDVAAHYAPSFELGGDFYDFLELGGHLGILIGDVVGKGVAAALLMSSVRASLRAHAQDLYHIDEVLARVNKALARDTLDNEFATVWYGVADPNTLRLTYCGAGHDWPLLFRMPRDRKVEDRDVQRLTADGMALGIDPAQKYPKGTFQLERGDVLVTFTDGLHDARDFEGKRFGGTRARRALLELLREEPDASASRIVDHTIAHLRQFTGLSSRTDDVTIVVLRVRR